MKFFGAIFLLFWQGAAAADGLAELSRAARYLQDGQAHTAEFSHAFTPAGFTRAQRESGTITVQAPENLRFDYLSPGRKTFTYDGETARFYSAGEKQMITRQITSEEKAALPLVFLQSSAALLRGYEVSLEEKGAEREIVLRPRAAAPEISWVRLALAPDGSPARLSYESASGDRTEFRFENFRTQPPRAAAEFRLRPPTGTRIVNTGP